MQGPFTPENRQGLAGPDAPVGEMGCFSTHSPLPESNTLAGGGRKGATHLALAGKEALGREALSIGGSFQRGRKDDVQSRPGTDMEVCGDPYLSSQPSEAKARGL